MGGRGDSSRFDDINAIVRLVSEASNSTDGVVGSLCGNTMTVSWGLSKRCAAPGMAALTFLAKAYARAHHLMTVGVGFGSILHGNVGTLKNRFVTVAGFTLDAAFAVASHCVGARVFCLLADTTPGAATLRVGVQGFEHCIRLVDAWHETTEDRKIRIYDLLLNDLSEAMACPGEEEPETTSEHNSVMWKFLSDNVSDRAQALQELRGMAERRHDDNMLQVCREAFLIKPGRG